MPAWPSDLPCKPILGTLRVTLEPNFVEFQSDVGRPQRRRRYTKRRVRYAGTLKLTSAQYEVLDDFYSNELFDGVRSFTMKVWARGSLPAEIGTFTFSAPPDFANVGPNQWRADLQLAREG